MRHGSVQGIALRFPLSALTAGCAALTVSLLALPAVWSLRPLYAVLAAVLSAALLATGTNLLGARRTQRVGYYCLAAAVLWPSSWWGVNQSGIGPFASNIGSGAFFGCMLLGAFSYPVGRSLHRSERAALASALTCFVPVLLLLAFFGSAEANGYANDATWPLLWDSPVAFTAVSVALALVMPASVICCMVLLRRRWRTVSRLEARVLRPCWLGMSAAAACSATSAVALYAFPSQDTLTYAVLACNVSILLIPAAVLSSMVRRERARSAVADLVVRMAGPTSAADVQQALREVLHDEQLTVSFWVDDPSGYVDVDGREVPAPAQEPGVLVPVSTHDGAALATVRLCEEVDAHLDVVEAAVKAAGLALQNARLEASLRAQLSEVRDSRTRIVEAQQAERHRLERDLHDGAQQRLLAVAMRVEVARATTSDAETASALSVVKSELSEAHREIRELARGILPGALAQSGLSPALEAVAARLPLPVHLDIPAVRLDPDVEAAFYFVACEALANAVTHSSAEGVFVTVEAREGTAELEVRDDGVGGASMRGPGIRGLADRVRALGGVLQVNSPANGGTTVRALIPCG